MDRRHQYSNIQGKTIAVAVELLMLTSLLIMVPNNTSASNAPAYSVQITLSNSQPAPTPASFQQQITINPSLYAGYERTDLGNIRFCADSACNTQLYAWLESCGVPTTACTSNSSMATAWVKLPNGIPASSSMTIYMAFLPTSQGFDGNYWGEAPDLSPSYGQYDNGGNVFTYEWTFVGTSLPSTWAFSQVNSQGGYAVNNGVSFYTGACGQQIPQCVNSVYGYFQTPLNAGSYLISAKMESYLKGNNGAGVWFGWWSSPSTPSTSGNYNGNYVADFTGCPFFNCVQPFGVVSNGGSAKSTNSYSAYQYMIYRLTWSGNNQLGALVPPSGGQVTVSQASSSPVQGSYYLGFWDNTAGAGNNGETVQWVTVSQMPPNGLMPTAGFASVTSSASPAVQPATQSTFSLIPIEPTAVYTWNAQNTQNPLGYSKPLWLSNVILSGDLWDIAASSHGDVTMTVGNSLAVSIDFSSVSYGPQGVQVIGYPNIGYGFGVFGGGTSLYNNPALNLPLQLTQLPEFISVADYAVNANSQPVDYAYDIWLTQNKPTSTMTGPGNGDLELMIWLDYENGMQPSGQSQPIIVSLNTLVNGANEVLRWNMFVSNGDRSVSNKWTTVYVALTGPLKSGTVGVDVSQMINEMISVLLTNYSNYWNKSSLQNYYLDQVSLGSEFKPYNGAAAYNWSLTGYCYFTGYLPLNQGGTNYLCKATTGQSPVSTTTVSTGTTPQVSVSPVQSTTGGPPLYVFNGASVTYSVSYTLFPNGVPSRLNVSLPLGSLTVTGDITYTVSNVNPKAGTYTVSITSSGNSGTLTLNGIPLNVSTGQASFTNPFPLLALSTSELNALNNGNVPSRFSTTGVQVTRGVQVSVPAGTFTADEVSYATLIGPSTVWIETSSGVFVKWTGAFQMELGPTLATASTIYQGTVVLKSTNVPLQKAAAPQCVIATAAFGSVLAPPVQFLREFRDQTVNRTYLGGVFLSAFNAWYYSWAPSVAVVEAGNGLLRDIVRVMITPLLGVLLFSTEAFRVIGAFNPDVGILITGLMASATIGIIYLMPLFLIASYLVKRRITRRTFLYAALVAAALSLIGTLPHGTFGLVPIFTGLVVIETIFLAPVGILRELVS